jgi:hypothetical protein
MAEAEDLKSSQCGFDPHSGHHFVLKFKHLGSELPDYLLFTNPLGHLSP